MQNIGTLNSFSYEFLVNELMFLEAILGPICRSKSESLDEEKSKHAGLAQVNGFAPAHVVSLGKAGERRRKAMHLLQKSVINMI